MHEQVDLSVPKNLSDPFVSIHNVMDETGLTESEIIHLILETNPSVYTSTFKSRRKKDRIHILRNVVKDLAETSIPLDVIASRYGINIDMVARIYERKLYQNLSAGYEFIKRDGSTQSPDMNEVKVDLDKYEYDESANKMELSRLYNPLIPISQLLKESEWDEIMMRDTLFAYNRKNECPPFKSLRGEDKLRVVMNIITDLAETHLAFSTISLRYNTTDQTVASIYNRRTYSKISKGITFLQRGAGRSVVQFPDEEIPTERSRKGKKPYSVSWDIHGVCPECGTLLDWADSYEYEPGETHLDLQLTNVILRKEKLELEYKGLQEKYTALEEKYNNLLNKVENLLTP